MGYQNCIFDLYGTLVDIRTDESRPELWRDLAAWYTGLGAPYTPEALREAYLAAVHKMETGLPGEYPEIQIEKVFWHLFADQGVKAAPSLAVAAGQRFREASRIYLRLYDGAMDLLKTLRAKGKGVWLLSNAQRIFTGYELKALGIENCFDGVYLSSDYGCKKPDPRFFEALLRERNIPPQTAIMVGNDGFCDIAGARALGLATLYIRSNLSPAEPSPEADYVLEAPDFRRVQEILL